MSIKGVIASAIDSNRNLFEEVARKQSMSVSTNKRFTKYTILNYKKILDEMCAFIDGYVSYKDSDGQTYRGKVLSTTVHFYEQMFVNGGKAYRVDFDLTQMEDIIKDYLEGSKRLQSLIDKYLDEKYKDDKELSSLIALTEKQYMKLMKVHKDDIEIYLWLLNRDNKYFRKTISNSLMSSYKDDNAPVIHVKFKDKATEEDERK